MAKPSIEKALADLHNGNISDFRAWVKRAHKIDLLDAIEFNQTLDSSGRHRIINDMRGALTETL